MGVVIREFILSIPTHKAHVNDPSDKKQNAGHTKDRGTYAGSTKSLSQNFRSGFCFAVIYRKVSKNSLKRQSNNLFDNAQAMVAIKTVKISSRLRYRTAAKVSSFFSGATSAQNQEKEKFDMSRSSNRINVPEAREAMDKFKMEAANDLDVPAPY